MRRLYFCCKMFTFEGYSITQTMKRTLMIVAAVAALFATSCKKPVNPDLPTINWASNPGFAQQELAPGLDGAIAVSAPGKIDMLTITLGLGDYAILANPYIGVSSNKGSGSKTSPVFDVVDDSTVASFLQSLGMSAGSSLRGKTLTNLDLVKILETLIKGQPVANNTSFTMKIDLKDQAGNAKTATAKFHFTSAPSFVWDNNASFAIVDLNEAQTPAKIKLSAPGKVDKFTITLENGADLQSLDAGLLLLAALDLGRLSAGKDKALFLSVCCDDHNIDLLADPLVGILNIARAELGSGNKCPDTFH